MHARSLLFFALGLAVAVNSVPLRAQSLAELAKKEEERRKTVPEPAKIYTNKDLTAVPGGTTGASVPAPGPAGNAGSAPAAESAPKDGDAAGKPAGPVMVGPNRCWSRAATLRSAQTIPAADSSSAWNTTTTRAI